MRREPGTTPAWWPFLLAAAALALYANALSNPFISDDEFVIVGNPTIARPSLAGLTKSWTVGYLHGVDPEGRVIPLMPDPAGSQHTVYRPVTTFTFWLNSWMTGVTPMGFRIVNILLHAAGAWMVGRWCAAFLGRPAGMIAAALVLCHPLATDVINRIVGRADILVLLAVPAFLVTQSAATASGWTWPKMATAAFWASIAIGAKELGAVLLPLALLQAWIDRAPTVGAAGAGAIRSASTHPTSAPHHWWRGALALLLPFVAYFAGRLIALGVQAPYRVDPSWDLLGNPLLGRGLVERLPASAALAASYLGMLVWPWPLIAFDTPAHVPGWSDAVAWFGVAAVVAVALGAPALAVLRNPLALPLAWWLACFLIVGQAIAPIHPYREVRLAYSMIGALGFAGGWLLGGIHWARSSFRAAALAATVIVCGAGGALIIERNTQFRSLASLIAVDARLQPHSGAAASRLGKLYEQQGRLQEAQAELTRATELAPTSAQAWEDLGSFLADHGRLELARPMWERALAINPAHPFALVRLGVVALNADDLATAEQYLTRAEQAAPEDPFVAFNLAVLDERRGRLDGAIARLERLVERHPDHTMAVRGLATLRQVRDDARGRRTAP